MCIPLINNIQFALLHNPVRWIPDGNFFDIFLWVSISDSRNDGEIVVRRMQLDT